MKVIFLKKDPGIFASLIRLWTRSNYDHCELLFNDNLRFRAIDGSLSGYNKAPIDPTCWDVVNVNIDLIDEAKIKKWCDSEVGRAYDWVGIFFSQFLPFGWHSNDKWFCSEIATAALQNVVCKVNGLKPWMVSPQELYNVLTK